MRKDDGKQKRVGLPENTWVLSGAPDSKVSKKSKPLPSQQECQRQYLDQKPGPMTKRMNMAAVLNVRRRARARFRKNKNSNLDATSGSPRLDHCVIEPKDDDRNDCVTEETALEIPKESRIQDVHHGNGRNVETDFQSDAKKTSLDGSELLSENGSMLSKSSRSLSKFFGWMAPGSPRTVTSQSTDSASVKLVEESDPSLEGSELDDLEIDELKNEVTKTKRGDVSAHILDATPKGKGTKTASEPGRIRKRDCDEVVVRPTVQETAKQTSTKSTAKDIRADVKSATKDTSLKLVASKSTAKDIRADVKSTTKDTSLKRVVSKSIAKDIRADVKSTTNDTSLKRVGSKSTAKDIRADVKSTTKDTSLKRVVSKSTAKDVRADVKSATEDTSLKRVGSKSTAKDIRADVKSATEDTGIKRVVSKSTAKDIEIDARGSSIDSAIKQIVAEATAKEVRLVKTSRESVAGTRIHCGFRTSEEDNDDSGSSTEQSLSSQQSLSTTPSLSFDSIQKSFSNDDRSSLLDGNESCWDVKNVDSSDSAVVEHLDGDAAVIRDDDKRFNPDGTLKDGNGRFNCGVLLCL